MISVPVFCATTDALTCAITRVNSEFLEIFWFNVAVILWMWIRKNKWLEIHSLGRTIAEEDVKAHVSCIFSSYDVKSCGFHTIYFTFLVIWVQRTLFFSTKKFIHFS